MAKLHELLAVQDSLDKQALKTTTELKGTFQNKRHLFEEKLVTFEPLDETQKTVTESQSNIQSTVKKEIDWISEILAKSYDIEYQIDSANTQAKADVVDEAGTTLLKSVPATTLLQLEKQLAFLREFILTIPTLDPAKGFSPDSNKGVGIFQAKDVHKRRTAKVTRPLTLAPATDKHPAQVQLVQEDVPTGTIHEQEWSSMITPATKSDVLMKCENLIRYVKQARSRANEVDVDVRSLKLGKTVLDYIFAPLAAK